jgi:thiamine kinase-like enzyme
MSPSQVALLKVAQSSDSIRQAIHRSAEGWNAQALLHGDLRLDNVLVRPSDSIALVDWECWGLGIPAWDVACPLADIVFSWITRSLEVGEDAAASHLRDIRIFSSQFWFSYADSAGAVGADPLQVAMVADLICCRLFQNAFESLTGEVEMNMFSVSALQFAHNLAESRLEIMSSVLGIT